MKYLLVLVCYLALCGFVMADGHGHGGHHGYHHGGTRLWIAPPVYVAPSPYYVVPAQPPVVVPAPLFRGFEFHNNDFGFKFGTVR